MVVLVGLALDLKEGIRLKKSYINVKKEES